MVRWRVLVLVALAGLNAPPPAAALDLSQTCVSPEVPFAVRFPVGWWVHPADAAREIDTCEFFGPVPFTLTKDQVGVFTGFTVVLSVIDGCVGDFRQSVSWQEMTIAGKQGSRIEFTDSEGDPTPGPATQLVYWIHLFGEECDVGETRYIRASTGSDDPEAYARNAAVLDAMMETFALGIVPDGAMHARTTWQPIPLAGMFLVVSALWIAFHAWKSRRGF